MTRFLDTQVQRYPDLTRRVLTRTVTFRTKRLIIFLTPGYDYRAGGIMAVCSNYRETMALRHLHRAKVALCSLPGDPPLFKYSWFENRDYILDLESVLKQCDGLDYLLLHMPAYSVDQVYDWLNSAAPRLLSNIREIHLNILLMNIDNIQGKNVAGLKRFGKVTCTTVHEAYSNAATREAMGVPLHRLLVCTGPEYHSISGYQDKDNMMIVSPDAHPLRGQVLDLIARALPDLTIRVIENLSYEDYMKLARRAKWSLTFGEGLDGYFVEPNYSGGIPFAVFNDRFFTTEFAELETVYPSWEVLMERITTDLRRLDEPVAYQQCWQQIYELVKDLHSPEKFRENLRLFYRGEYTFP